MRRGGRPVNTCAVHGEAAIQRSHPPPARTTPRFYRIAQRLARRMEPAVSGPFLRAVREVQDSVSESAIRRALTSGHLPTIEQAARAGDLGRIMAADPRVANALLRTSTITGEAGADVLSNVTGATVRFNARDPRVVQFAERQAGVLVRQIDDAALQVVRFATAIGADVGLTTAQQAHIIRQAVGLRPDHVKPVMNFTDELMNAKLGGKFADRAIASVDARRLDAATKAKLKKAIREGITDEQIAEGVEKYTESLVNYRAKSIARTETLRASHHGQQESWKQAQEEGHLPETARRIVLVTPDDRLEHWMVPGMNEGGRGMDEPFEAPEGTFMNPPFRTHCRCGVGLTFPGYEGVL